jgi:DNA-binding CsgD family transcriptional regulator/tetratricopeptide (TPR) repeat protein
VALGHYTAVRDVIGDQGPSRVLNACLAGRSDVLADLGQLAEAAADARRSLALAREMVDPVGQVLALIGLGIIAWYTEDTEGCVQLYRQALQVPADIPGYLARMCSIGLTDALRRAGDLAAAERVCADGLTRSREVGDQGTLPDLLARMALLDVEAGRAEDAAARLQEALQIIARAGMWHGLINVLSGCAELCAATGRRADAVTVRAARLALAEGGGVLPDTAWSGWQREAIREARRGLGDVRGRAAEARGAAMSPATVVEYALLLTAPDPGQPEVSPGLGQLSARERELVTLVARGRTNAQIAAQLYISIRTVDSHLERIRDKTGCRRRADLTRLALTEGLA